MAEFLDLRTQFVVEEAEPAAADRPDYEPTPDQSVGGHAREGREVVRFRQIGLADVELARDERQGVAALYRVVLQRREIRGRSVGQLHGSF